jgi:hypothetical protein
MLEKIDHKPTSIKEWLALSTACVALVTAALNFLYTANKMREQEARIDQLSGCSGIAATITEPSDGDTVAGTLYVNGEATPSDVCQYVFIVVRDKSRAAWKVADVVQTNGAGQWYGVARIDDVARLGGDLEIIAKMTSRATDYTVNQFLPAPPSKGISSTNIVRTRRTK